jgi:heme a synthase
LVTSHGVGMSVPDWPNTYGYNMFAFPISQWVGGIFYEHSHRLLASTVGLLTTILAIWLWTRETRARSRWLGVAGFTVVLLLMGIRQMPVYLLLAGSAPLVMGYSLHRIRRAPRTLRWWGVLAFAAVILQGVLGGLRVVWIKDEVGIFHAALAQLFFVLICALAVFTSRAWTLSRVFRPENTNNSDQAANCPGARLRTLLFATTALIFVQLVIGATMRHQHAGLAIPDFPLAYGKLWPATDAASVAAYNHQRLEVIALNPITSVQILLQMVHRLMAGFIVAAVGACAWLAWRNRPNTGSVAAWQSLGKGTLLWFGLILVQAGLGAATIWTGKAADVATLHVLAGALSLATGTIVSMMAGKEAFAGDPRTSAVVVPSAGPEPFWPGRPSPITE